MSYRTVEIRFAPQSARQWQTFGAARQECAHVWNDLVRVHARIRRLGWKWPSKSRFQSWAKRRYPYLSAQTVQQIIAEFLEAVNATHQKRKNGSTEARYPYRILRFRDVPYTNQDARLRDCKLLLPNGRSGTLAIPLPSASLFPGRLMEVRLCFGKVLIVCEVPLSSTRPCCTTGNDLGVNTLIAATDGQSAILVSGKEAKASVQWRNKRLASLQAAQAAKTKGSRRWKRLQRRKYKLLEKSQRRIRDLTHKATAAVQQEFPAAQAFVGEPFNEAAQTISRRQAQQVASTCNRKVIQQLSYKGFGATTVSEAYSSQTCPVCGGRRQCRRIYQCQRCGYTAPRDVVGALNILRIGTFGVMTQDPNVPTQIKYRRPTWGGRRKPHSKWRLRSSGGHPARSSAPS